MAILQILGGLGLLLLSFVMFGLGALFGTMNLFPEIKNALPQWLVNVGTIAFIVAGFVLLVLAIINFLLARGFLRGKRWARVFGMVIAILEILGVIFTAITSGSTSQIANIGFAALVPIIILLYLMLPNTKAWFTQ
jgi:lysylphosphatidylglycerol synthetase-like protein (DUF2156 family)